MKAYADSPGFLLPAFAGTCFAGTSTRLRGHKLTPAKAGAGMIFCKTGMTFCKKVLIFTTKWEMNLYQLLSALIRDAKEDISGLGRLMRQDKEKNI